ncbi:PilZ domain-containing protein [Sphingomonas sp. GB1N7]|uniref:PilZ domain-containing protein n=1 Tax=Parasphingomonas caseinilytica TaxID=3096158 RepID=UPI002FC775BF
MPRHQVLLAAEISGFGSTAPSKHRIKNLSVSGAQIDHAGALRPGSTVLVTVGTLEAIGATVIWVDEELAGLKFAESIDPARARSKTIISTSSQSCSKSAIEAARKKIDSASPPVSAGWLSALPDHYRS